MTNRLKDCSKIIAKEHFFIKDGADEKPAFVVDNNGEFEVSNKSIKDVFFLEIDSCLYDSSDNSRCDCAIYDDEVICFIELKHSKRVAWKRWREKAEKQLKDTIQEFATEDIIQKRDIEAYMCCTYCDMNGAITKISRASNISETIIYFEKELNTKLYCNTKKEFN